MRNHASELQVFLATKEIEIEISKWEKEIEELTKAYSLSINSMILHENEKLSALISEVSSFGEISIDIKPSKAIYTHSKGQHAQIKIERRTFDDLKLKLKLTHKLELKATTVIGSAILENDTICFSQSDTDVLTVANMSGSILHTIKLPKKLYDITHVNNQTVAVTTGSYESQILIVDLKTRSLEKTIKTKKSCYGISFDNGSLIHNSTEAGLLTLNLENDVVAELGIGNKVSNVYVAVHDGKIYCTNKIGPSVQCYNDDKSLGWEFKDKLLIAPRGIAVDEKGIVYVGDQSSGNVVIISHDGSTHEAVKIDSIPRPRTLSFNKTKTRLLICGLDGQAGIFVVS
ncbi:Hypothetical predicted protein [Mytilus galloprovincialis]|uniref:Uncharacterized protein n=1 Tax=Mytilus galloprovincialis TaxID=29158 RepID=A0A8B6DA57_MYTGA|nr:Hypothetical predicted protein [Mytilus galloprovincialis]